MYNPNDLAYLSASQLEGVIEEAQRLIAQGATNTHRMVLTFELSPDRDIANFEDHLVASLRHKFTLRANESIEIEEFYEMP